LLHAKLDQVLAGQAEQARRGASHELLLSQVIQAVNGLTVPLAQLREAVVKLAEAAGKEGKGDGEKLARTLKAILDELGKQTGHMAQISVGLERIPAIMEDTAVNAVELATGGGAGARPSL
jgi:hypothetical protein